MKLLELNGMLNAKRRMSGWEGECVGRGEGKADARPLGREGLLLLAYGKIDEHHFHDELAE